MPTTANSVPLNGNNEFRAGNIHNKASFWLSMELSTLTRRTIMEGFLPIFHDHLEKYYKSENRRSALNNTKFVSEQIEELLRSGAVSKCDRNQIKRINPLSVAEGKKLRLVLDLSDLNKCLEKNRVKFEDISKIRNILPTHGFMTCFDLRSGYHHVFIHESFRGYLGFQWDNTFYNFNVLPFGLSPAPFIFTKIMKPLITRWRSEGIGVAVYLDDGIIWGETKEACRTATCRIRQDLYEAGFFVAEEKCSWQPSQQVTWLGHKIDLCDMSLDITEDRKDKAFRCITSLLRSRGPSLRERMKWLGTLASMHLVIPREHTKRHRSMTASVADKVAHGCKLSFRWSLAKEEKQELQGWFRYLENSKAKLNAVYAEFTDFLSISTDASMLGVGAILQTINGHNLISRADLPRSLLGASSTIRELYGIRYAIKSFASIIFGEKVQIKTDSQTAQSAFYKGSSKTDIQRMAAEIWDLNDKLNIKMSIFWIPRELNCEADWASRIVDLDSWSIYDSIFDQINERWGPFEVDLFADKNNKKCDIFISRWFDEGCSAVNAFSESATKFWTQRHCWLVPPPCLLTDTIFMARKFSTKGVIGFPLWPSHTSFMSLRDGSTWIKEILDTFLVPKGAQLLKSGSPSYTFKAPSVNFDFVFAKIDFT